MESSGKQESKKSFGFCFLTVFVTGNGNVVDCSEFDTGVGQNLEFISG